ncbi:hypothetical protein C8Q74DRAFT_1258788 [Fomes fomentarius]|nr:hypothetical protein C8Q74DRAFT_1258788 [Fomes fomentarius]
MSDVANLNENSDYEEPLHMSAVEGGGYFALQLGDILRDELEEPGQWEIVRKLGWGSNANVWLVKDSEFLRTDNMDLFCALKVLTAAVSEEYFNSYEREVFTRLRHVEITDHPGYQYCLQYIQSFEATSTHGHHVCIMTAPYAGSLASITSWLHERQRYLALPNWVSFMEVRHLANTLDVGRWY